MYYRVDSSIMVTPGTRFLNRLIDFIVLLVLIFLLGALLEVLYKMGIEGPLETIGSFGRIQNYFLETLVGFIYYFLLEATTSRSVGKMLTGTIVVNEYGERPTAQQVAVRSLCRMIPFNAFSFFGTPSRGWHDSIPNTYVVDAKKLKESLSLNKDFDQIGQQQF